MSNINYTKPNKLEDFSVWCSKKYPLWCKSNFPFIEDTIEALDTYGLICKIVQYLNETKQNLNTTEDNVQNIYDFVTNYFDNLDVQKEINNKLDSMISSGELQRLLSEQYNQLRNEVNSELHNQNEKIDIITNKINSVAEGSPAGVYDTLEELIQDNPNHSKIYLVKEDGEWYYWDNSINQWNNGGVYQSTLLSYDEVEVKNLNKSLKDITNSEYPIFSSNNGYYRNQSSIIENNSFLYTTPIRLLKNHTLECLVKGYLQAVTLLCLVNENNEWIQTLIQSSDSELIRIKFTAKEDCFVSICSDLRVGIQDVAIYYSVDTKIKNIESIPYNSESGYYINQYGDKVSYVNNWYSVTDYIKINPNSIYEICNIDWTANDAAGLAFYDNNKNFISYIKNERLNDYEITTPFDAKYIRFTFKTSFNTTIKLKDSLGSIINDLMLKNYLSLSLFEKFGIIGDSYASGELYFNDRYNDKYSISWGQILARKLGTQCENYSSGGLNTRTWLTSNNGLTKLLNTEKQDIYYLCLGINDYYHLGLDYLGSIDDIKENYELNPDTFYGNYAKIIENIKNYSPNSKIILFTTATTSELAMEFNNAIINIAKKYNLPYVKIYEYKFFNSYIYSDMVGGHPTALGYSGMSNAYEEMIKDCIISYYPYFRNYFMY